MRITTATSTPPSTFSRSDVAVSLEESPPFPRKRQPMAEDGEDVNAGSCAHNLWKDLWTSVRLSLQVFDQ
ncbi:MAG: hypothetical protein JWQ50_9732 [Caballeronia mineralivorans]|nr:hypothetical protein [Caballeronia mineralivorans]